MKNQGYKRIKTKNTKRIHIFFRTILFVYFLILSWGILSKFHIGTLATADWEWLKNPGILLKMGDYRPMINFIPLAGSASSSEVALNIVGFIPFGFLLVKAYPKFSWANCVILVVILSLFYEMVQYVLNIGILDITDVMNNSIGGIVGIIVGNITKR